MSTVAVATEAAIGRTPGRASRLTRQRVRYAWLFMAPMLVVLALVAGWPLLRTVWFGFTDANLSDLAGAEFVGFLNYYYLLQDPDWWNAVWNTVRFAWWSAEESGLVGSTNYVNSLSPAELDRIALYLNFDMVGSPNFVRFVYDGSGDIGPTGPAGSAEIEDVFNGYFAANGLATEPTPFDGRSDYQAFINNLIPAGGLFTGAEGTKSAAQAAIFGGTAGAPYDPCYHQACDTFANNSDVVLDQMSDAIAHATITFAQNTSLVNGVPGKGNFNTPDKINGQAIR